MTRRSRPDRYLRGCGRSPFRRLGAVRVRTLELRLLGVGLVVAWTATAGLILLAYRPGGPIDLVKPDRDDQSHTLGFCLDAQCCTPAVQMAAQDVVRHALESGKLLFE